MIDDRAYRIAAVTLTLALSFGVSGARGDPTPISQAETLLFMTPHLKELKPPSQLHYAFRKQGTLEKGFSDKVDIDITSEADGGKKGAARFFTGERQVKYPDVEHAQGNQVLLFYLEREIREMSRLTGGRPDYFKKRIRAALADSAQIKNVDIQVSGRTMHAQQITIAPYGSDPLRERFERLATKQYIFTMCDTVPGVVYEMRGVVLAPSGSPKDEAVIDETLTFTSVGKPE